MKVKSLSCVQLLATPWTAAYQAPPSMGFARQEYWSGVPLPSPSRGSRHHKNRNKGHLVCKRSNSTFLNCLFRRFHEISRKATRTNNRFCMDIRSIYKNWLYNYIFPIDQIKNVNSIFKMPCKIEPDSDTLRHAKSWLIGKDSDMGVLRAGGKGDDRGWDGWMASLTWWTWVWVNSRSWWWTGRPGVLRFMGSKTVRHDWATELNWTEDIKWTMAVLRAVRWKLQTLLREFKKT